MLTILYFLPSVRSLYLYVRRSWTQYILKVSGFVFRVHAHTSTVVLPSDHDQSITFRKKENGVGMALNVATLPLILYRQVKTIKHGSVRIHIVHFLYLVFLIFAVPFLLYTFFISTCSCPFITTCTCMYTLKFVKLSTTHSAYSTGKFMVNAHDDIHLQVTLIHNIVHTWLSLITYTSQVGGS